MARSKSMVRSLSILVLPGALALSLGSGCRREEEPEHPVTEPGTSGAPEEGETSSPAGQTPGTAAGAHGTTGAQGNMGAHGTTGAQGNTGAQAGQAQDVDLLVLTIVGIDIDTKLAQMCGLPGSSVFFKYDSAKLSPEAKDRLQQIATCAISGAAKGKDLVLVGRTDPTGSDQYNQKLGMTRAETVARYLRSLGVSRARVETESKGESGAMKEPMAWPLDRRVTIRLQP